MSIYNRMLQLFVVMVVSVAVLTGCVLTIPEVEDVQNTNDEEIVPQLIVAIEDIDIGRLNIADMQNFELRTPLDMSSEVNQEKDPFPKPISSIETAYFDPEKQIMLTVSREGILGRWNAESGELLDRIELDLISSEHVETASISQDGATIVTASNKGVVDIWDAETGESLSRTELNQDPTHGWDNFAVAINFSVDGGTVLVTFVTPGATANGGTTGGSFFGQFPVPTPAP